jgi:hypothetical protein
MPLHSSLQYESTAKVSQCILPYISFVRLFGLASSQQNIVAACEEDGSDRKIDGVRTETSQDITVDCHTI